MIDKLIEDTHKYIEQNFNNDNAVGSTIYLSYYNPYVRGIATNFLAYFCFCIGTDDEFVEHPNISTFLYHEETYPIVCGEKKFIPPIMMNERHEYDTSSYYRVIDYKDHDEAFILYKNPHGYQAPDELKQRNRLDGLKTCFEQCEPSDFFEPRLHLVRYCMLRACLVNDRNARFEVFYKKAMTVLLVMFPNLWLTLVNYLDEPEFKKFAKQYAFTIDYLAWVERNRYFQTGDAVYLYSSGNREIENLLRIVKALDTDGCKDVIKSASAYVFEGQLDTFLANNKAVVGDEFEDVVNNILNYRKETMGLCAT